MLAFLLLLLVVWLLVWLFVLVVIVAVVGTVAGGMTGVVFGSIVVYAFASRAAIASMIWRCMDIVAIADDVDGPPRFLFKSFGLCVNCCSGLGMKKKQMLVKSRQKQSKVCE